MNAIDTNETRKVEPLNWELVDGFGPNFVVPMLVADNSRLWDGSPCQWRITKHGDSGFTLQDSDQPIRPIDSRYRTIVDAMAHAAFLEDAIKVGTGGVSGRDG